MVAFPLKINCTWLYTDKIMIHRWLGKKINNKVRWAFFHSTSMFKKKDLHVTVIKEIMKTRLEVVCRILQSSKLKKWRNDTHDLIR